MSQFSRVGFFVALSCLAACGGDEGGTGDTTATTATDTDTATSEDTTVTTEEVVATDSATAGDVPLDEVDETEEVAPDTDDTTDTTDTNDASETAETADVFDTGETTLPGSCLDRCGHPWEPTETCQCDAQCQERGDCCADLGAVCAGCADPDQVDCGEGCIDPKTSLDHCGGCDKGPCVAGADASAVCEDGVCKVTCAPGFEDCNGDASDGCEADLASDPQNCNECNHLCDGAPFGAATCRGGKCGLECQEGRGACDATAFNGCETNLTSDVDSCGVCGVACPESAHAIALCDGSACGSECEDGFEDCNGSAVDGCEADLVSGAATCGACDRVCGPNETCVERGCACTGAFDFAFPPTPRNASVMAVDGFHASLLCGVAESSLSSTKVTVNGAVGGAITGALTLPSPNDLAWTASGAGLAAGEAVDITIAAGLRSFDSLKTAKYRVLQGYAATGADGSGAFVSTGSVASDFYGNFALGDFDGDGDLDLATPEGLYLNDGSGTYGARTRTLGLNNMDVFARDLDGDGYVDLFIGAIAGTDTGNNRIAWGAATNPLATTTTVESVGFSQRAPAFGDLDGDGDLDLVLFTPYGAGVKSIPYLLGKTAQGAPTFTSLGTFGAAETGHARLVDFDGDGDLDYVQANYGLERFFTNNGSGVFAEVPSSALGLTKTTVRGMAVGDLDRDGYADAVITNIVFNGGDNGTDQILRGSATGTFTAAPGVSADAGPVALGDVDGDGDLDIVGILASKIAIYRNDGTGTFSGGATAMAALDFVLGDVDSDGDLDLLVHNGSGAGSAVTIYKNNCAGASCSCGNLQINGREECDDGPAGSQFCDTDCTLSKCGDALVNATAGEICDDGNKDDADACRNSCVPTTCGDQLQNRTETDVDCGGDCAAKCGPRKLCELASDCQSGQCLGGRCAAVLDFEDGQILAAFTMGGTKPWSVDGVTPVNHGGQYSLISGDLTVNGTSQFGSSSTYLTANFGDGGAIDFHWLTNCLEGSKLVFFIDGVRVEELTGRREQLTTPAFISYSLAAGSHTFEWRYEGKIATGQWLIMAPFNRGWVDDIRLINGAP